MSQYIHILSIDFGLWYCSTWIQIMKKWRIGLNCPALCSVLLTLGPITLVEDSLAQREKSPKQGFTGVIHEHGEDSKWRKITRLAFWGQKEWPYCRQRELAGAYCILILILCSQQRTLYVIGYCQGRFLRWWRSSLFPPTRQHGNSL